MSDRRPLVVYLPGLDGTGRLLYRQPRLHERYEVHCVSYPQDNRHSYADLVALAIEPLERAGGGIVLAESFGGAVSLKLALERPELVHRLVLINTFAWFPHRLYIELLAAIGPNLPAKPSNPASRPLRGIVFFSPDVAPEVRRQWWDLTADVPMNAMGHRFYLIERLDRRPQLCEIRTPTLVVASPDDRVVPHNAGVTLARRMPNAHLLQPRVGHAAMVHPAIDVAAMLEQTRFWEGTEA
jgi:pimeloyl-ACP methyl ester carboxylesterase